MLLEVLPAPGPLHPRARAFVLLWPLGTPPPRLRAEGAVCALAPRSARRVDPETKSSGWRVDRHVHRVEPSADEHLLVDGQGGILEGFTSNFFALSGGTVWTAWDGVLPGVTRGVLLDVFEELGLEVRRSPWPVARLDSLDEAGLSSAIRGLLPVSRIDGAAVGAGRPGPIFAAARRRYAARIRAGLQVAWPEER